MLCIYAVFDVNKIKCEGAREKTLLTFSPWQHHWRRTTD